MRDNSIQDDLNILHDIEEDDFNPLNMKPGAGQCGEQAMASGKIIFVEGELNGSIGSRNDILYSGGSSLISLNQAFHVNRRGANNDQPKQVMTIMV